MPRPRRILVVFCLIAGLCLQGFALARQMSAFAQSGDAEHAAMHLDAVAHHHEGDGSIQRDSSKKSLEHLKADCCVQVAGLLPHVTPSVPALPLDRSRAEPRHDAHDSPFLEGLKRPPR
jgi:hypothetical protein